MDAGHSLVPSSCNAWQLGGTWVHRGLSGASWGILRARFCPEKWANQNPLRVTSPEGASVVPAVRCLKTRCTRCTCVALPGVSFHLGLQVLGTTQNNIGCA
jgi:hypothetical protein